MKKFFAGLTLLFTLPAHPCTLAANLKGATWVDNFKTAQMVMTGHIVKKTKATGGTYTLEIKVNKAWKGKPAKTVRVTTRAPSTCDSFGDVVEVEQGCLLFLDTKNEVISGLTEGESSFCLPPDAPRWRKLPAELEAKLKIKK